MLKRSINLDFAGGAYVFPGGAVDSKDSGVAHRCSGHDDSEASEILGIEHGGLDFFVAAIRECFEEAGVLLARSLSDDSLNGSSGHLNLKSEVSKAKYGSLRNALNRREISFAEVLKDDDLELLTCDLAYVSHWITPPGNSRRYDTRFFVAMVPQDQEALHDDGETVENIWIAPSEALRRYEMKVMPMVFPTIRNLRAISSFSSAKEVMEWASTLKDIPTIAPVIVHRNGRPEIIIPGE